MKCRKFPLSTYHINISNVKFVQLYLSRCFIYNNHDNTYKPDNLSQHNVEYHVSYPGVDSERQGSENRRGGGLCTIMIFCNI